LVRATLAGLAPKRTLRDRIKGRFASLHGFSVGIDSTGELTFKVDATFSSDEDDLGDDLTTIFCELGEAASECGQGAVLLVDEIQFLRAQEFAPLLVALHRVVQKGLPIAFAGAGLPQLPKLVGEAKSYAERMFDFISIDRLKVNSANAALVEPARDRGVHWTDGALSAMLEFTDGYPFFLQQYAKYAWLHATEPEITEADVRSAATAALQKLDLGFFEVRLQRTTGQERRYLAAMASLEPPYRSRAIANVLGESTTGTSYTRDLLIRKGLIFSRVRGEVDFTVPHFADFISRHPDLET
jgi:hypothetical protein